MEAVTLVLCAGGGCGVEQPFDKAVENIERGQYPHRPGESMMFGRVGYRRRGRPGEPQL